MTDETTALMDMMSEMEMPRAEEMPVSETLTGSKKNKSKQRRKAKREAAAEPSTSTPRVPGLKETVLQEALGAIVMENDETEVWEKLDQQFGKLPEPEQPTPSGAQAPAVLLQETPAEMEEERMGENGEAMLPR